ncbi:MAG: PilZ domain-containing protein [Thermodesulfobacteriota bacterium]
MEENRRQRRIPISAEAMVHKIGTTGKVNVALFDISNYGASFKTTVPFRANDRIEISISVSEDGKVVDSEDVDASIRWVERSAREVQAGVKFDIMISEKGFPLFNQCLEFLKTH